MRSRQVSSPSFPKCFQLDILSRNTGCWFQHHHNQCYQWELWRCIPQPQLCLRLGRTLLDESFTCKYRSHCIQKKGILGYWFKFYMIHTLYYIYPFGTVLSRYIAHSYRTFRRGLSSHLELEVRCDHRPNYQNDTNQLFNDWCQQQNDDLLQILDVAHF